MQTGHESGAPLPVTHCVAISRDAETSHAIARWAAGREWSCQVEADVYLAWTKLLLIEKSRAERARWGLQTHGRSVLLIDDRACDGDVLAQLSRAFDRYTPTTARITLHNGVLPHADLTPPAPIEESRDDAPPSPMPAEADDEDDDRLSADEIRMLLGDDSMEPVT